MLATSAPNIINHEFLTILMFLVFILIVFILIVLHLIEDIVVLISSVVIALSVINEVLIDSSLNLPIEICIIGMLAHCVIFVVHHAAFNQLLDLLIVFIHSIHVMMLISIIIKVVIFIIVEIWEFWKACPISSI